MTSGREGRLPHASLDAEERRAKAEKIERLLGLGDRDHGIELLEIGTGSGAIAQHFATHPGHEIRVTAVDVVDQLTVAPRFEFQLVEGTLLPFEDSEFDVVISNHVLEHVGDRNDQSSHLREIGRVLKPDGIGYLATPNRWALLEPHYRLVGLSWLPERWRTSYLRLTGRGERYDCAPLSRHSLESLIAGAGLVVEFLDVTAVRATLDIEDSRSLVRRFASRLPDSWISAAGRLLPTHVCRLRQLAGLAG